MESFLLGFHVTRLRQGGLLRIQEREIISKFLKLASFSQQETDSLCFNPYQKSTLLLTSQLFFCCSVSLPMSHKESNIEIMNLLFAPSSASFSPLSPQSQQPLLSHWKLHPILWNEVLPDSRTTNKAN
jgi:hypothetical protein